MCCVCLHCTSDISESCSVVSDSLQPHGLYSPWDSPGQNTGMGSWSLLQGIFPTQRSNPGLLPCRRILYQLSHKGSPIILEWVAFPSLGDLPDPGIKPGSPALQVDSLPTEISGKPCIALSSVQFSRSVVSDSLRLHYFIFNLPNILFFQYYQVDQKSHCGFFIKSYRKPQMKLLANPAFTETLLSR